MGPAVDEHGAGAADGGPADKVENQGRVLLLPQPVQSNEDRHVGSFVQLKILHPGFNFRRGRVIAKNAEGKGAILHRGHLLIAYLSDAGGFAVAAVPRWQFGNGNGFIL